MAKMTPTFSLSPHARSYNLSSRSTRWWRREATWEDGAANVRHDGSIISRQPNVGQVSWVCLLFGYSVFMCTLTYSGGSLVDWFVHCVFLTKHCFCTPRSSSRCPSLLVLESHVGLWCDWCWFSHEVYFTSCRAAFPWLERCWLFDPWMSGVMARRGAMKAAARSWILLLVDSTQFTVEGAACDHSIARMI